MGAMVQFNGGLTRRDPKRLALFKNTVGKQLVGDEINEAVEWCEVYGANPFTKDIYFFVFDADEPAKRRVVPVLGIGLYRKIAARTGNYRPDPAPPRFAYDETKSSAANPTGMIWCEVTVYLHSHGEWHPVTSRLKWEERAPIIKSGEGGTEWEPIPGQFYPAGHKKAGKQKHRPVPVGEVTIKLDPRKSNWLTMPETMMGKCTEADAIRKGWPSETAGSYVQEEMDAAHTIDLTATEIIDQTEQDAKLSRIGGKDAVLIDWGDGKPFARISIPQAFEQSLAWMADKDRTANEVRFWLKRNEMTRGEMKAKHGSDYLNWWMAVDRQVKKLDAAEAATAG